MSRLKKSSFVIVMGLLGIIVLVVGIFILINLGDETRSAEVEARLASRLAVAPEVLEGYRYELGLFAPVGANPLEAGRQFYSRLEKRKSGEALKPPSGLAIVGDTNCFRRGLKCWPVDFKQHLKENQTFLAANRQLLQRYNEYIKFPGASGNVKRSMFVPTNDFSILNLARMQRVDWMVRIAAHEDSANFFSEWKASNDFYRAKLRYPDTVLGTMISLLNIKEGRAFLAQMMQEFPALHPPEAVLQSAKLDVPFDTMMNNIALAELEMTDEVVHQEMREGFFSMSGEKPPLIDLQKLLVVAYRPNQTLNDAEIHYTQIIHHPCVTTTAPCPERERLTVSKMIKNPVGNLVIDFISGLIQPRLREAFKQHAVLAKPFSATEPSS